MGKQETGKIQGQKRVNRSDTGSHQIKNVRELVHEGKKDRELRQGLNTLENKPQVRLGQSKWHENYNKDRK